VDLNEIKNRAKDLLADLTEPRPERDSRPARDHVDDPAVGRADDPEAERVDDRAADPVRDPAERVADPEAERVADPAARTDRLDLPAVEPVAGDPGRAGAAAPAGWEEPPADDRLDDRAGDRVQGRHQLREPAYATGDMPTETARPAAASTPTAAGSFDSVGRGSADPGSVESLSVDPGSVDSGTSDRLVTAERADSYSTRWEVVKGEFVDEPRQAVVKADALVGELLDELGQLFDRQRSSIEHDLDNDDVSTEELRVALRRYRSFFDRLLSV